MSCHISSCPRHNHPCSIFLQKSPHTNSCDSGSVPSWTVESLQILFARFALWVCRHGYAATAKPAGLAWVTMANALMFCKFCTSFVCFCMLLEYLLEWKFHIIHSGKSKVLEVSLLMIDCQCQGTDRNSCPQIAVRSQISLSTMK